jgi:hypothetical protein
MTAPSAQSGFRGKPAWWRNAAFGADLRIGDTERGEVADQLSRHYADGRLDQEELSERLDKAMNAKTWSDLTGVLADLPDLGAPGTGGSGAAAPGPAVRLGGAGGPARRRPAHALLRLVLIAFIVIAAWHLAEWSVWPLAWVAGPLTWAAILGLAVLLLTRRRR